MRLQPLAYGSCWGVDFSAIPELSQVYRSGWDPPTLGTPVFLAYDLFTLRADHVT